MANLPTVGDTTGSWGSVLNTFLQVAHNADGTMQLSAGAGTQGSVVYCGASGALAQDNANFFWDATNHRLGIGTVSPAVQLHTTGSVRFAGLAGLALAQLDASGNLTGLSGSLGAFSTYTPTVTPGSGAFTTVSASGRYLQIGKLLFWSVAVTDTTNGTAGTYVQVNLPNSLSAAVECSFAGVRSDAIQLGCIALAGNVYFYKYDGSYPGAGGTTLYGSGVIEVS